MKPSRIQGTFPLTLTIVVILAGALVISLLFFSFWQKINKNVEVILKDQFNQQQLMLARKIFHPFFTTKEKGTGLGLAVIHKIITDHEGIIELETSSGAGTTFTIRLPVKG
jgi:nitrogen-specific signal transduction histidine kinase